MWSVEIEECTKWNLKGQSSPALRRAGDEECGYRGVQKMRSVENEECGRSPHQYATEQSSVLFAYPRKANYSSRNKNKITRSIFFVCFQNRETMQSTRKIHLSPKTGLGFQNLAFRQKVTLGPAKLRVEWRKR